MPGQVFDYVTKDIALLPWQMSSREDAVFFPQKYHFSY